ncbi:unnamed protein product [Paramecium sonneborni]|uniref:Uncharacterized protein n=1 Tax=Paramecium sonneborni TaxID=65129 RepID=A0A8S1R3E1_9CILI|nr:unnamed protein product [Paramecium sonneborni]
MTTSLDYQLKVQIDYLNELQSKALIILLSKQQKLKKDIMNQDKFTEIQKLILIIQIYKFNCNLTNRQW